MKVIAYIRTSTKDQLAAYGPARQREAITAWAKQHGHRIVAEVIEDVSGTIAPPKREAWKHDVLEQCCAGNAAGVVVADLSRLTRNQVHLELTIDEMAECEALLFSTSGEEQSMLDNPNDPQRKLIRTIIAAINEYDRAKIVERVQAGRRLKKANGGYAGGQPPYGYRGGDGSKELVPDAGEQAVVRRVLALHRDNLSTHKIAATLNAEGMTNRKGGAWASASVARIIKRETATV